MCFFCMLTLGASSHIGCTATLKHWNNSNTETHCNAEALQFETLHKKQSWNTAALKHCTAENCNTNTATMKQCNAETLQHCNSADTATLKHCDTCNMETLQHNNAMRKQCKHLKHCITATLKPCNDERMQCWNTTTGDTETMQKQNSTLHLHKQR